METPTFFANSLRFAGKSDALAELCGRCALHTAEKTGEIRPSILSFCVLQLHAALAGCAELERGHAVLVSDEEVTKYDDIHSDENIDVLKIVFHDFYTCHEIARGNKHVVSAPVSQTARSVWNLRPLTE